MFKKVRKNQKGFTLVELIVVIAILAVLAMLIVPRIMGNIQEADEQTDIANARTLASEIAVYNAQNDPNITGTGTGGAVTQADYTGPTASPTGLTMPDGVVWPDPTVVVIKIDTNGNPSVDTTP